jgi:hypothetical protein
VVSKKFIKFFRKSLKKFGLNLKRKVVLKGVWKRKEKKKANPSHLSAQPGCRCFRPTTY